MRLLKGFSLIELMIVIAIIGILTAIAFPNYNRYVVQARRTDATSLLLQMIQQQERYFTEQLTYTTDLMNLGYGVGTQVPSEGGHYLVSATACAGLTIDRCVLLTAEPQGVQSADGNITLDSRGIREPATHWQ